MDYACRPKRLSRRTVIITITAAAAACWAVVGYGAWNLFVFLRWIAH